MFHFLFVPLTLGLSVMVACMETKYARSGDETYLRMTKFWGKLFLVNFALGVVTGIALEFQIGTNWSRYASYVGNIFGPLLVFEALVAFFLESTFIGVWIFGWNRLSAKAHATVAWLIAIASNLSAFWILTANAWMQHPVGFELGSDGRIELTDFLAILTNKFAILEILHNLPAAFLLSSFFVMGVSAWHLLKKQNISFFEKSFRMALVVAIFSAPSVAIIGDIHGANVAKCQPTKFAAMEATWETQTSAPLLLFALPDEGKEKNKIVIGRIPGLLSLLGHHDISAEVKGLRDFPRDERPPVLITFIAFRVMIGLGILFIILTATGFLLRKNLIDSKLYLWLMVISTPLPYIAIQMGWVLAEVGRQPWIVYGLLKTADAVSPISVSQVSSTLLGFVSIYVLLGITGIYLISRLVKKGPESA
jgi:cytochrome d ubiquinol oxidase subunit I